MCKEVVSDVVLLLLVLLLLLLWMSLQPNFFFLFLFCFCFAFFFKVSDMSTLRETNRRLFLFTLHLRIIAEKRYNWVVRLKYLLYILLFLKIWRLQTRKTMTWKLNVHHGRYKISTYYFKLYYRKNKKHAKYFLTSVTLSALFTHLIDTSLNL